jgi:hypothetical protein
MRKILLGISVLVSLAFLAACGSGSNGSAGSDGTSGTSGTAGTDGTDGTNGTDGTITVFTDTDLLASFNGAAGAVPGSTPTAVPLDSGAVIGKLSGALAATGTDNLTAGSRNRYYQYTETSAGVQNSIAGQAVATAETGVNSVYDTDDDGIFDTRLRTSAAVTNTLTDYVLVEGVAGTTYSTAYFSICPGNEAGDGACSKVLAPAYDRGIGTASPMDGQTTDLAASITYAGSSFHVLGDNGTGGADTAAKAFGYRFTPSKTTYSVAVTSDNTSSATHIEGDDNHTRVSNILTIGTNVWFAMSADNSSTGAEGDNVSLAVRANGTANFTDNGTKITNTTALTTAPQIASSGDGVYVMLGAGTAVSSSNVRDNGTTSSLGAATVGTANTWCSASTGTASEYAVIVSDNATTGIFVDKVYDNGTTTRTATGATSGHTDLELCALTHLGGTFYLGVTDETGGADNVSVWKSTDLATWTQIGSDYAITSDAAGIAIGTTGSSASDAGVWVAVNDAGAVEVLHYEDIAGGSTSVWRSVGTVLTGASTGAVTGGVSIATDGTSVIAVSAVVSDNATAGFWYNQ